MASNPLPDAQAALWALATDMLDGLAAYETAVGIVQNSSAKLAIDLAAARETQAAFERVSREEDDAIAIRNVANSNVKAALALIRRQLGDDPLAEAVIWRGGSLETPYTIPDRLVLLGRAADFLRDHPDYEIQTPKITFTESALRVALTALEVARGTLNQKVQTRVNARGLRDTADKALRARMRGLIQELSAPDALSHDDDRWYAFGLVPPVGVERPGIAPDDLVLRLVAPGIVLAGWSRTPRARAYRIFAKVAGRDADFEQVSLERDRDYTFEGLPTTGKLEVYVVATNPAGDSPASETAELTLG